LKGSKWSWLSLPVGSVCTGRTQNNHEFLPLHVPVGYKKGYILPVNS
jgi:hypothetical protein